MSRLRKQIKTLDAAANAMRGVHVNHGKETWPRMSVLVRDAVEHLGSSNPVRIAQYLREEHEPNISTDEKDVARVLRDSLGKGAKYGQLEVDWHDMKKQLARARETERMDGSWRKGALFGETVRALEPEGHSSRVPDFRSLSNDGRKNLHRLQSDARKYLGGDVDIIQNEEDIEAAITTRWPEGGDFLGYE